MSRFLVVVPAYNEADTIEEVVRRSLEHADVCVVDDASTDDTPKLVEAIPGAHCIRHTKNTHIAGALLDGFRYGDQSGYDFCVTMDAGLSHDPAALPSFQSHTDADLVIGYRERRVGVPWYRTGLSRGANALMNLALQRRFVPWGGAGLKDVTSGYRMYSRAAVRLLLDAPLESRAFDFHIEALTYVFRAGMKIEEVPIEYEMSNSSLRPQIVIEALRTCARLWVSPAV